MMQLTTLLSIYDSVAVESDAKNRANIFQAVNCFIGPSVVREFL